MEGAVAAAAFCLIFLNGATDASAAIASAVSSGALSMRRAALLAAMGNLAGGLVGSLLLVPLSRAAADAADFGEHAAAGALASVAAAALFTLAAWMLHLPTSESHALLSAAAGASLVLGRRAPALSALLPAVCWMLLGAAAGVLGGAAAARIPARLSGRAARRLQIALAASASVLHGAQDLPKFLALAGTPGAALPGAAVMGLGASLGGRRMADSLGESLASLDGHAALASDLGCAAALLFLSVLGVPVSTTYVKAAAVAGCALASPGCRLHGGTCAVYAAAWFAAFPVCCALGALFARLLFFLI